MTTDAPAQREPGWYWARRKDDAGADDPYSHVVYHSTADGWYIGSIGGARIDLSDWDIGPSVPHPDEVAYTTAAFNAGVEAAIRALRERSLELKSIREIFHGSGFVADWYEESADYIDANKPLPPSRPEPLDFAAIWQRFYTIGRYAPGPDGEVLGFAVGQLRNLLQELLISRLTATSKGE